MIGNDPKKRRAAARSLPFLRLQLPNHFGRIGWECFTQNPRITRKSEGSPRNIRKISEGMKEIRESCPLITRRDANRGEVAGERKELKRKTKDRGAAEVSEDAANHADGREWWELAKTGLDNQRARWGRRIAAGAGCGHPAYRVGHSAYRESHSVHREGSGEARGCPTVAYSSGRGLSLVSGSRGRTKMPSKSTKLTAMPAVRKPSRLPPRLLVI